MHEIAPAIISVSLIYVIYRIFELFVRRKERMAIIEKLSLGIDPLSLQDQFNLPVYQSKNNNNWAIRIGLLLFGIGLGIAVAIAVDLSIMTSINTNNSDEFHNFRHTLDILYPACAALFGGLGLVVAYIIEKKYEKKNQSV